ncbi:unnamed protein product, partial [Ixodes persulcatus]
MTLWMSSCESKFTMTNDFALSGAAGSAPATRAALRVVAQLDESSSSFSSAFVSFRAISDALSHGGSCRTRLFEAAGVFADVDGRRSCRSSTVGFGVSHFVGVRLTFGRLNGGSNKLF